MADIKIKIDEGAREIIARLNQKGYKAYIVGGCVRDLIMGKTPYDWDITTSALPEEILEVFSSYYTIPTGIKHGTVTVRLNGQNYEVTTFRKDGDYKDSRHPENVDFVTSIEEDLKRRDFTVNSMAYSENEGLIDLYGGLSDINNKIIRAVGNPYERFSEDTLRILRGARFSSSLGFEVEENTKKAMFELAENLKSVSVERVFVELDKLLLGKSVKTVLLDLYKIIFVVIPELEKSYKFAQHSKWHKYDVYEHTAVAVESVEKDSLLRWCMLLHDIGKPDKFFIKDGEGHFYGHPERSEVIAKEILERLKVPTAFKREVCNLILIHDKRITLTRERVKKALSKMGDKTFFDLMKVKLADNNAQSTSLALAEKENVRKLLSLGEEIVKSGECYSLSCLAVDGNDILKLGIEGKKVGEVLERLLDEVIFGNIPNEKERLIASVKKTIERGTI